MTEAVAAAGFQDAYRSTHPDPVAAPGITWTFGTPFPRLAPDVAVDRIDMVHASAGIQVLDSGIAGPPGTPDVTWPVDPYPSDHRAVAATVRLTPAAPGNLRIGDRAARHARRADLRPLRRAARRGHGPDRDRARRRRAGAREHVAAAAGGGLLRRGDVRLGRARPRPLRRAARDPRRSRALAQHVLGRAARRAAAGVASRAGSARARRSGSPGATRPPTASTGSGSGSARTSADLYNSYLTFAYTGATVAGATRIRLGRATYPPGEYVVRLMRDDGYGVLDAARLTVLARARQR